MSEPSQIRERRNFRSMLALVILVHLGVAALPVAWVKFHPSPPAPQLAAMAAEAPVIEWIEPELLAEIPPAEPAPSDPDPVAPVVAATPAPKPIANFKPRPKLAASPVSKRKPPPASASRSKPAEVKAASFQSGVRGEPAPAHPPPVPSSAAPSDAVADYHARIQRLMEQQWKQPPDLAGSSLPAARVAVSISRSGEIQGVELAASSGQSELDASALAAARSVRRIDPLPSEIANDTYRLIIRFVLH